MKSSALAVLLLAAAAVAQDPPAPDPVIAAERLQQALADRDVAVAVDAVQRFGRVAADKVIELLGHKALRHKDPLVQREALKALRWNAQPSAVTALLSVDVESVLADDDTAVEFFYALGQKADPKALPILTRNLHITRGSKVVAARIHAIGRTKCPEAVDELMRLLKSGGGGRRGGGNNPHMADLRLSLAALTGQDFGNDRNAWIQWWADHDEGYKVPKPVVLPDKVAGRWQGLWQEPKNGKGQGGK